MKPIINKLYLLTISFSDNRFESCTITHYNWTAAYAESVKESALIWSKSVLDGKNSVSKSETFHERCKVVVHFWKSLSST